MDVPTEGRWSPFTIYACKLSPLLRWGLPPKLGPPFGPWRTILLLRFARRACKRLGQFAAGSLDGNWQLKPGVTGQLARKGGSVIPKRERAQFHRALSEAEAT